jgi:broad specificity phosphatase PhoE
MLGSFTAWKKNRTIIILIPLTSILLEVLMLTAPVSSSRLDAFTADSTVTIIKAWRHGETKANKENLTSGGGPDDSAGITALNEEGIRQAETLGELVYQSGPLDSVYTSDLSRASDTARGVLDVFKKNGKPLEERISLQLREILSGQFELTNISAWNTAAGEKFERMLVEDLCEMTPEVELKDKYRFWKVHPLVDNSETVQEDVVDVADYLKRGETRPETPYHLWQRVNREFIRIAQENPGKTVGVSTHGAVLTTLIDGLNKNPKGIYLPPHYNYKEFKLGDQVAIPAAVKVENCALIYFKYDSKDGMLELFDPDQTQ